MNNFIVAIVQMIAAGAHESRRVRHAGVLLDGVGDAMILKHNRESLQGRAKASKGGQSATNMYAYRYTFCRRAVVATLDLSAVSLDQFDKDHWLAALRAERDRPASHRACRRGSRRADFAAPLGPALQAAVGEHSSTVGRRASARAHGRFHFQTTGNDNSSLSRGLGASCGLKF